MIAVERSGIEVDSCISCRGLWFDRGEIDLLAEMSGVNLESLGLAGPGTPQKGRKCPRCDRHLEEMTFGALRIDRCPQRDGLWLDRGELGALFDRTGSGPMGTVSNFLGEVFGQRLADEAPPRKEEAT